ncbi:MAG: hypothetical protein K2P27_10560, partial [Lachnospiraceae bacterium]|nr:hypothetical protein [Lachnospiraceae bacterium]
AWTCAPLSLPLVFFQYEKYSRFCGILQPSGAPKPSFDHFSSAKTKSKGAIPMKKMYFKFYISFT